MDSGFQNGLALHVWDTYVPLGQDYRHLCVQVQTLEARSPFKFGIRVNPSLTVGLLSPYFAEYTGVMNLDDSVLCTSTFKSVQWNTWY